MRSIRLVLPWVVGCLVMILMINLGFWQLRRAAYKTTLLSRYTAGLASQREPMGLPAHFAPTQAHDQYRAVQLQGHFMSGMTVLLEHKIRAHQLGYEVLDLFQAGRQFIWVNRGWISRADSEKLPPVNSRVQTISGLLVFPEKPFTLGKVVHHQGQHTLIQRIDFGVLKKRSGHMALPVILRLQKDHPDSFIQDWQPVTMSPAKHRGYAFQWFAMSLTLAGIMMYLAYRKWKRNHASSH